MEAKYLCEYVEAEKRYWTCDNVVKQVNKAMKTAKFNYLKVMAGNRFGYLTTVIAMLPLLKTP